MFERAHRENWWGSVESVSGPGSTLEATSELREMLPQLLWELEAYSLLDVPCGDFGWMSMVDLKGVEYVGLDIVPDIIAMLQEQESGPNRRFFVGDIVADELPTCDVVLCRDCLIHLSNADAKQALRNIANSGAKFALITSASVDNNREINTGSFRPVNLELPPFELPPPMRTLPDYGGAFLGLWRAKDLCPPSLSKS